jgi:hypothetical protein
MPGVANPLKNREWRRTWVKKTITTENTEFTEKIKGEISVLSVRSLVKDDGQPTKLVTLEKYWSLGRGEHGLK